MLHMANIEPGEEALEEEEARALAEKAKARRDSQPKVLKRKGLLEK